MDAKIKCLIEECDQVIQGSKHLVRLSKETLLKSQELLDRAAKLRQRSGS